MTAHSQSQERFAGLAERAVSALLVVAVLILLSPGSAGAQWYVRTMADSIVLNIRGETADTAALNGDRYVEDNLDYLLQENEWLIVNFSAYWCPDSDNFAPGYYRAARQPEYHGLRWAYAEIDGTRGNESFRDRFALPGIPVVILFHLGTVVENAAGKRAVLDGHLGGKTYGDLIAFLTTFYQSPDRDKKDQSEEE